MPALRLYQFTGMVLTINLGVTDGVDHWLGYDQWYWPFAGVSPPLAGISSVLLSTNYIIL